MFLSITSTYCLINQAIALKGDKNQSIKHSNPSNKYYKVLDGRNIDKFTIRWNNIFLEYNLKRIHSCKRKDIFLTKEKLFFRRVALNLIFAYDNKKYFALNTLVVVNKREDCELELKYILALLNSKLLNYIYKTKFKSTKKVFSEIQARSVGLLPIKKLSTHNRKLFIDIVDQILKVKENSPSANTSALENKIDLMVYKLYWLDHNEVKIVDPQFDMSEAEYNRLHLDFEDENSFETDRQRKQIA